MSRIIAGRAGGRRIETPEGPGTRPTTDRVREALFSRLDHLGVLADAAVLDLYAGSGALGLEAVSRGAARAVLVEAARAAAAVARRNARTLGLEAHVVGDAVEHALATSAALAGPFDLVFADPPYDLDESALAHVLAALAAPGRLAADAVVVVERSDRSPEPTWPPGLTAFTDRTYGQTRLWLAEPVESSTTGGKTNGDDEDADRIGPSC